MNVPSKRSELLSEDHLTESHVERSVGDIAEESSQMALISTYIKMDPI